MSYVDPGRPAEAGRPVEVTHGEVIYGEVTRTDELTHPDGLPRPEGAACPDAGAWRAWLDGEAASAPADPERHLAACPACRVAVGELWGNAALATAAVDRLAPSAVSAAATARARERLGRARQAVSRRSATGVTPVALNGHADQIGTGDIGNDHIENDELETPREATSVTPATTFRATTFRRWRVAAAGLAAAFALTLLAATPAGQTAAAQFLAQFRSQRFAVVTLDPDGDRSGLRQLERLGTVQGDGIRGDRASRRPEEVASIEEASRRVGIPLKQADPATLPAGVSKTPKIAVMPASEVRFTFDRDKAREYFRSIGRPEVALPDKFHGASLVVQVPAAALLAYDGTDQSGLPGGVRRDAQKAGAGPMSGPMPGLVIGQSREVQVGVDGKVTLEEMRTFLLDLPGLPDDLTRQLRSIQDWQRTLPLPIPADRVNWQPATIGGGEGLILADNSGLGGAAIWQRDGRVTGVAGSLKADELRRVADGLK